MVLVKSLGNEGTCGVTAYLPWAMFSFAYLDGSSRGGPAALRGTLGFLRV